jgi:hypothetical protein
MTRDDELGQAYDIIHRRDEELTAAYAEINRLAGIIDRLSKGNPWT